MKVRRQVFQWKETLTKYILETKQNANCYYKNNIYNKAKAINQVNRKMAKYFNRHFKKTPKWPTHI